MIEARRVVAWFSAGAASAVATKLTLKEFEGACIAYCDTGSEHPDNWRFIWECEEWFGKDIILLKSKEYRDTWDVFERTRYLVGPYGARCTTELKKIVRREFQRPDDLHVFGFTCEEKARAERFRLQNPELESYFPLVENQLSKVDCKGILERRGIELPIMYRLGYRNNNCIGCVKGGQGYWNKIRRDFPEVFARMVKVERELNISINRVQRDGEHIRVFLDELDPDAGRYIEELDIECDPLCAGVAL